MLSFFSMLRCSGRHWGRAALAWALFAMLVQGLAGAGAESAGAECASCNSASTPGAFNPGGQVLPMAGQVQVADVSVSAFDPGAFQSDQFGDNDDLMPVR
ncbi:MAG: hypothetical protein MUC37_07160 [Hyphomicrobium sp.]|jgi:hypothetical protein|nr:hypothetical protein [Hyphomicrobium sp.]